MPNTHISRIISMGFFCIFGVLTVTSFATPNWIDVNSTNYGLWKICFYGILGTHCAKWVGTAPHLTVTQAMTSLALVSCVVSFVLYCYWVSRPLSYLGQYGAGKPGKCVLAFSVFGGLCTIVGVIVFAAYREDQLSYLGYSFYMACVSGLGMLLNGSITLCAAAGRTVDRENTGTHTPGLTTQTTQPIQQSNCYSVEPQFLQTQYVPGQIQPQANSQHPTARTTQPGAYPPVTYNANSDAIKEWPGKF